MKLKLVAIVLLLFLFMLERSNLYQSTFKLSGIQIVLSFFVYLSLHSNVYQSLFLGFTLGLLFGFSSDNEIMGLHSLFYGSLGYFLAILANLNPNLKNYYRVIFLIVFSELLYNLFFRFSLDYPLIDKNLFVYLILSLLVNLIFIRIIFFFSRKLR